MTEFIKFLKEEVLVHTAVEIYSTFYLKEPLKIGTFKGTDLFCNYISSSFNEDPSIWVIFNEHEDDLWGNDFDFSYISLSNKGVSEYGKDIDNADLVLFDNWTDLIADKIKSYPDLIEWCLNYVDAKKLSYKWSRWCHKFSGSENKVEDFFTWQERLEIKRADIFLDKLSNRRQINFGDSDLKKMLELGEDNYDRVNRENAEAMRPMLDSIFKKMDWL